MAVLVAILIMLHCAIFGIGVSATSFSEEEFPEVSTTLEDDSDASSEADSIYSAQDS